MKTDVVTSIERFCGYAIGYTIINCAVPHIGLKEFCLVTFGGVVLILTATIFSK